MLAEADHLPGVRAGSTRSSALRTALREGAVVEGWWRGAAAEGAELRRPGLDLTDASPVVLAERERSHRVATLDERHVRTVRPTDGSPAFVLLPADACPRARLVR